MFRIAPFILIFAMPLASATALKYRGVFWVLPLVLAFIVYPAMDVLFGENKEDNSNNFQEPSEQQIWMARALTVLYVPVHFGLIIYGCHLAATRGWTWWEWLFAIIGVGLSSGASGITTAHELVHRTQKSLRFLGGLLLSSVCFGHYMVEHVHGHHTWVATPEDPATARKNESIYKYYFRAYLGGIVSGWNHEKVWLQKKKKIALHNRLLLTGAVSVLLSLGVFVLAGPSSLLFFIGQSVTAFSVLIVVDYVEHYGLLRQKTSTGQYEPIAFHHSWDCNNIFSNWILLNLEKHSDHHKYPLRDFVRLRKNAAAPQLPAGYPLMVLLALVPSLWFKKMNSLLEQTQQATTKV